MDEFLVQDLTAGTTYPCRPTETVLQSMKRSGKGCIKFGCGGGGCGVCKIRLVEGKVDVFKRMSKAHVSDADREKGYLLACCIKPVSNIVLEKAQ